MDLQGVVWFIFAAVAGFSGMRILVERYIFKQPQAVQSRGGHTLFALCMLVSAAGALAAGLVSILS